MTSSTESHEPRAVLNELVAASRARCVEVARHGEDLAALLQREVGRDERPTTFGRLNHNDTQGEAADNPVSRRESLGERLRAEAISVTMAPDASIFSFSSRLPGG